MYISSIKISGFRNFKDSTVEFQEGVNVIIGHNNAGKTNLLKALALIIDTSTSKKLEIDDFNKNKDLEELKNIPPKVQITLNISESIDEDLAGDDLATVSNWLVKLESPYLAKLTYEFFLPQELENDYITLLSPVNSQKEAWNIIKHNFLRKYINKIYVGDATLKVPVDIESIQKFDYQFLNAIRDVERDMFTGKNTLLREVVDFFMDYEIKNSAIDVSQKIEEIKAQKELFSVNANSLLEILQTRMKQGEEQILKYAQETGASFNKAIPGFEGSISESELYSTLRLIIKYNSGIEIPATHNGLGYNNLIFMSLLLAKMQVDTNGGYLGSNAKVFPVLVIEEPEAHLHPAMQYKFLRFLKENIRNKARQLFITSHSTHITSAVSLDEIICLSEYDNSLHIGYPGKVFLNDEAGKKSKAFVQRFLDATRSDILFAKNVILVEGMAEQLLMSTLARYHTKSLEDEHVTVINISGRYFDHFLKLFDISNPKSIRKRISCITDRDPEHKAPGEKKKFKSCYPFENNADGTYQYKENSSQYIDLYKAHANIRFFSQDALKGKTLEYDLAFCNSTCKILITESIDNKDELTRLMDYITLKSNILEMKEILRMSDENTRIFDALNRKPAGWTDSELARALIAARYLKSVGKGENALELALALESNLNEGNPASFTVPKYITEAIDWVCPLT